MMPGGTGGNPRISREPWVTSHVLNSTGGAPLEIMPSSGWLGFG